MKRKPPLLLLPGICCRGNVFDRHRGPGLAYHLEEFCRLFPRDLRCATSRPGGFDFDDHVTEDLPRMVREVTSIAGEAPWILGHSMGAQAALAAAALGSIEVRGVIAVAPPCVLEDIRFYPPVMRLTLRLARLLGARRIPIRLGARLIFWWFAGVRRRASDKPKWRGLPNDLLLFHVLTRRSAFDVPTETLAQATLWVSTGVWCDRSGRRSYLELLDRIRIPTLFIAGSRDRIATPEAVRTGRDRTGGDSRFASIEGASHVGLLGGPFAAAVSAVAREWMERRGAL